MKELPILCQDGPALAIREGRQTEHRVPVRPRDPWEPRREGGREMTPGLLETGEWAWLKEGEYVADIGNAPWSPGDLLYVREAVAFCKCCEGKKPSEVLIQEQAWYRAGGGRRYTGSLGQIWEDHGHGRGRWWGNQNMPKAFARTWVEVTDVWPERLQDIDEAGCLAEGMHAGVMEFGERHAFMNLWDSLYKARGFGWDVNPWVWVCRFRRIADHSH